MELRSLAALLGLSVSQNRLLITPGHRPLLRTFRQQRDPRRLCRGSRSIPSLGQTHAPIGPAVVTWTPSTRRCADECACRRRGWRPRLRRVCSAGRRPDLVARKRCAISDSNGVTIVRRQAGPFALADVRADLVARRQSLPADGSPPISFLSHGNRQRRLRGLQMPLKPSAAERHLEAAAASREVAPVARVLPRIRQGSAAARAWRPRPDRRPASPTSPAPAPQW